MFPVLPLVVHGVSAARAAYSAYRAAPAAVAAAVPLVKQVGPGADKSVVNHSAAGQSPFKPLAKNGDVDEPPTSAKLKKGSEPDPSPKPPSDKELIGLGLGAGAGVAKSYHDWNPEAENWRNVLNSAINISAGVPWGLAAAAYPKTAIVNGGIGLALGQYSDGATFAGVAGVPVSYLIPNTFGGWNATYPGYALVHVATGIFGLVVGAAPRLTGVKE